MRTLAKLMFWMVVGPFWLVAKLFQARAVLRQGRRTYRVK